MTAAVAIAHEFDLMAEVQRLRAELAAYKAQPFVPRSEYDRVCEAKDAALSQLDVWAGALSAQEDQQARISHLTSLLARLLKQLDGKQMSTHEEQADVREARAVVAESGER